MNIKKFLSVVIVGALSLSLVACGNSSEKDKKIVVGASPNPHSEILKKVVKPILAKEGYDLVVKDFDDYVLPNKALSEKSIDANYFQHEPYLDEYNKKNGSDIVSVAKVHLEPMGIYSDKIKNLKDIKSGAIIAIPNDPTNESRALKLLAKEGLIKVSEKKLLTKKDVIANPKNIDFKEIAAQQLPTSLKDVDLAVINSNFALQAKLDPLKDSLAIESKDSPYSNIIAVRADNADSKKIKALKKAIQSDEVKKYIAEHYKGAIIPSF